jgi:hypothetical protein
VRNNRVIGGETLDKKQYSIEVEEEKQLIRQSADHVGGITEASGGVDPDIDENLMRLSGGP